MEKYKDTLKIRIAGLSGGIAALVTLLILNESGTFRAAGLNPFPDFLRGFQSGILFSVCIVFGFLTGRYVCYLCSEEKRKAAYYAENDERHQLIMLKIGGNAMYICTVIILLMGIAAGYFNATVFFSLTGCALFLLIVRCALKIYYSIKL